jgi:hypothetical protein
VVKPKNALFLEPGASHASLVRDLGSDFAVGLVVERDVLEPEQVADPRRRPDELVADRLSGDHLGRGS